MSGDGARVEAAPRLAQWRVSALPCYTYRKSEPFRTGLWNWCLSVERNNKQTCVKLFVELSNSAKNTAPAPIASFVTKLLISFPPNQETRVHPGIFDKRLKHDGFVWAIDNTVTGRFLIEIRVS